MSRITPNRRPTLKTISQLTGLAVPTVSRALSDAPDISSSTKQRVRDVAAEIGYKPNRAGVRLRTGRTQVIAIVLLTSYDAMNQTAMLIESIASELRGSDYHVNILPYFPDEDPMSAVKYVVETGAADGIIFNGIMPEDPRIEYLQQINFPFACHGRSTVHHKYPWFDFDHRAWACLAIAQFADRGRKNIVLVAPPADQAYGLEFISGSLETADLRDVNVKILETADSTSSIEDTRKSLTDFWLVNPEIDAFLCASSTSALVLIGLAKDKNVVIGSDFDVVTREFMPLFTHLDDSIISVLEDIRAAGEFLARAIVRLIDNPDEKPMQMLDLPRMMPVLRTPP